MYLLYSFIFLRLLNRQKRRTVTVFFFDPWPDCWGFLQMSTKNGVNMQRYWTITRWVLRSVSDQDILWRTVYSYFVYLIHEWLMNQKPPSWPFRCQGPATGRTDSQRIGWAESTPHRGQYWGSVVMSRHVDLDGFWCSGTEATKWGVSAHLQAIAADFFW